MDGAKTGLEWIPFNLKMDSWEPLKIGLDTF